MEKAFRKKTEKCIHDVNHQNRAYTDVTMRIVLLIEHILL